MLDIEGRVVICCFLIHDPESEFGHDQISLVSNSHCEHIQSVAEHKNDTSIQRGVRGGGYFFLKN